MISKAIAIIGTVFILGACGTDEPAEPPAPTAPSEVTGVITEIESGGLNDIESFTVQSEGNVYEIFIADDVDYGFPLRHLNAHRAQVLPVRVQLEVRDGDLYALTIEDA